MSDCFAYNSAACAFLVKFFTLSMTPYKLRHCRQVVRVLIIDDLPLFSYLPIKALVFLLVSPGSLIAEWVRRAPCRRLLDLTEEAPWFLFLKSS